MLSDSPVCLHILLSYLRQYILLCPYIKSFYGETLYFFIFCYCNKEKKITNRVQQVRTLQNGSWRRDVDPVHGTSHADSASPYYRWQDSLLPERLDPLFLCHREQFHTAPHQQIIFLQGKTLTSLMAISLFFFTFILAGKGKQGKVHEYSVMCQKNTLDEIQEGQITSRWTRNLHRASWQAIISYERSVVSS